MRTVPTKPRAVRSPSRSGSTRASDPRNANSKGKHATAEQIALLETHYTKNNYPTADQRIQIAQEVGRTPNQVKIWFQNR